MLKTDLRELDSGQMLFDAGRASALLGISRAQLYKEMAAGRLKGLIIGSRTRRFSRQELERYVIERSLLSA